MPVKRSKCRGWLLAVALAAACGDGASARDTGAGKAAAIPAERVGARQVQTAAWDTVFVIGGGVQDTLLLIPRLLAARGGQLYAFDYGDSRIGAGGVREPAGHGSGAGWLGLGGGCDGRPAERRFPPRHGRAPGAPPGACS